jgi:hypothetical protein
MSKLNASAHDELDPVLAQAAKALRGPIPLAVELEDRVMAAVRQSERPSAARTRGRLLRVSNWATASQTVEISPLKGFAIAAGLAALLAGGVWLGRQSVGFEAATRPRHADVVAETNETIRQVQFTLVAPGAAQVMLVGDFNGWSAVATPLHVSARHGTWSVTVPLATGRHEYAFLVDGKHWLPDPRAPLAPGDDFGTPNSVLTVTERS